MVSAADSTMLSRPVQDGLDSTEDHLSGLSRARLYLNLPRRKESEGGDGPSTPSARTANRLRSISNSDGSSLRSYPSLPSLESDMEHGLDGDATSSHKLTSPTSTSSSRTQAHIRNVESGGAAHLQPWEWEISRQGFIPSPLPSPGLPDGPDGHPHTPETRTPKIGSAISANSGSRTDSFFTTSFKSLPTPPRPLANASTGSYPALADAARALTKAIDADGESLPPSPTLAVGSGASTLGAFGSRPRAPADLPSLALDSHGVSMRNLNEPASASAVLNRARSLGEQTRAMRNRQRGATIQNGRSSAFYSTNFVAYPPGMQAVEGVPTPASHTPVIESTGVAPPSPLSLGVKPSSLAPRLPSTLRDERNPSRSVTDPTAASSGLGAICLDDDGHLPGTPLRFQQADRFVESPVASTSQLRERLVRERSRRDDVNEEAPRGMFHYGRTTAEIDGARIMAGDVLLPESSDEGTSTPSDPVKEIAWRIQSVLGEGAFSTVWAGRKVSRNRPTSLANAHASDWQDEPASSVVAIKMMDKRICRENDRTRISFVREVQVLQHISHRQVVSYLSSFSTPSHHCLVLGLLSGGELFDLMQRPGNHAKIGDDFIRRVFGDLARGVGWLHEVGVVHRDLKLENIMFTVNPFEMPLTSDGNIPVDKLPAHPEPLIKLTDFGLARFIDKDNPLLRTRCGSESFAAPEIVMGQPYDGRKTDSWACGVVLYALLTGELPFDRPASAPFPGRGESDGDRRRRMMRIAKGQYDWPEGHVHAGARAVVSALLQRDPTRRARVGPVLWETLDWMRGPGAVPCPTADDPPPSKPEHKQGRATWGGWLWEGDVQAMAAELA